MKIALVLLVALNVAVCFGSPVGYQQQTYETARNANNPVTPNSVLEEQKAPREHYQASRSSNQPTRQEYRRFGTDAVPQNTQADNPAAGFNTNERKTTQNQNTEIQATYPGRNQVSQFPPVSESTQVQKSNFRDQDLRSDSRFDYSPVSQVQTTMSSQEIHRSGAENTEDRVPVTPVHSIGNHKGTPFGMERRLDIQSGMYESSFEGSFPRVQDQISQAEEAAFQNQNDFRSAVEDQRFQNQQTYHQNAARGDHRDNQGQYPFPQRGALATQDQTTSSQRSQEQVNQFQTSSQQSERPSAPVSSYERDNFFNQGQIVFDSRRISSAAPVTQQLEHASGDDNKYFPSSAQFQRNQQNERSQNRQISGIKGNVHFEEKKHSQTDNRQQSAGNTQSSQGHFHSIDRNQPAATSPKNHQINTPVIISGTKGSPAIPVMVYKTGSAASPHAVVLGQDLTVINKASVSQHVQTPFAQYTYTHPL